MAKMPAFQFYPADWRKDLAVQSLTYHDRGIWFEILCLMHESEERGVLLLNGLPMPIEILARNLGVDVETLKKTEETLLKYGVIRSREKDFALYNSRMVKDEKVLQMRRTAGQLGGEAKQKPSKSLAKVKQTTKQKEPPSSSSSSSSSTSVKDQNPGGKPPCKVQEPSADPKTNSFIAVWIDAWNKCGPGAKDIKWAYESKGAGRLKAFVEAENPTVAEFSRRAEIYFTDIWKTGGFTLFDFVETWNKWAVKRSSIDSLKPIREKTADEIKREKIMKLHGNIRNGISLDKQLDPDFNPFEG